MYLIHYLIGAAHISLCVTNVVTEGYDLEDKKTIIRQKKQLPLNINCNVLSTEEADRCYKGDLINESIADCSKTPSTSIFTCDPINDESFSTSVNVPDVDAHGMNCTPVIGKAVLCGDSDTRCVCDAPFDFTSPLQRDYFFNRCRCQYWPDTDIRESQPALCRQYDHGGVSGVHFYACCNNCNDDDMSCDGDTYQGGGTTDALCGTCGTRIASEQNSRLTYTFNCDSCTKQQHCREFCNTKHPIARVLPGLCPKWIGCFRGCCLSNKESFCGDNICCDGETTDNCPSD